MGIVPKNKMGVSHYLVSINSVTQTKAYFVKILNRARFQT